MLNLQDPTDDDSPFLQETLLGATQSATGGGAAFAWATHGGVKLLLRDPAFEEAFASNTFELIVGVHAVTTPTALRELASTEEDVAGLTVKAFLPADDTALFHPKFSWFAGSKKGALVIGSGNMTVNGLRESWEAYANVRLDSDDLAVLRRTWNVWTERHEAALFPCDDDRVLERAEKNTGWKRGATPRRPDREQPVRSSGQAAGAARPADETPVLVAEIPKSGDRWQQANFNQSTYEGFFGARVGSTRRVLLQHVGSGGGLGAVENRPSVEVKSKNYRFELGAAPDESYPDTERPIGVFFQVRPRTFLYQVVLPKDGFHEALDAFLKVREGDSRAGKVRRARTSWKEAGELRSVQMLAEKTEDAFADEE